MMTMMMINDEDYIDKTTSESFPNDEDLPAEESDKDNLFSGSTNKANKKSKTPVLDNFGRDINFYGRKWRFRSYCREK